MAQRKKKPDKLIAGFLALLTEFSPVASVVPVYASGTDDGYGNSVTMNPNSIQIDEQDDGIVIDSSGDDASGITVIGEDDNNSEGDGGIQIDDDESGDGITIDGDEPDDGINIGETEPDDGIIDSTDDGITIGDISVGDTINGITIDSITKAGDGIIIESTDEDGEKGITIDPWGGEDINNLSNGKIPVPVPVIHELSIDIRNSHGVVMLTPVSGTEENQSKYIRLSESDDGYNVVVTDNDGNITYEDVYDDAVGVAWSEFLSKDAVYGVTAIADDNYVVTDYSIVNPLNQNEVIERYPNYLRKHFWKENTFWTDGYFACSVGNVSEEMLCRYIENQG